MDKNNDLGFGDKATSKRVRLLNADGSFRLIRRGERAWHPYQAVVQMSWRRFFAFILAYYIVVNAIFALIFVSLGENALSGEHHPEFWFNFEKAFFFSVQTSTTVGYGGAVPSSLLANIVSSFDALIGLMAFALATGLFFARFSKPSAMVAFSKNAIVAPYRNGLNSLQIRIANRRSSQLTDMTAQVSMSWVESANGHRQRRFLSLPLERDSVYMFPTNWNLVHPIAEDSPMKGKTLADLEAMDVEFIVFVKGFDEIFGQMIHSKHSYTAEELIWGVKYKPMYFADEKLDVTILDLYKINDVEKAELF